MAGARVAFETLLLGSGSNTLTVPHQGFGMVYDSSSDFLTASCDGLFVRPLSSALAVPSLPIRGLRRFNQPCTFCMCMHVGEQEGKSLCC